MSQDVVSFVLRFVRDAGQESGARWRGKVQHVQGSAERQFSQFSEALSFMQEHMNSAAEAAAQDSAELAKNNPWIETAKLWGEFVPQYNKLVLENMETVSSLWKTPAQVNAQQEGEAENLEVKLDMLSKQLVALTGAVEQVQQDVADIKKQEARSKKQEKG